MPTRKTQFCSHSDRRSFLKLSGAGGIGLTIFASGSDAAAQVPESSKNAVPCFTTRPSAADAVLIYGGLLNYVESSELRRLGNQLGEATGALVASFKKIDDLTLKLKSAVCPDPENVRRIEGLRSLSEVISTRIKKLSGTPPDAVQTEVAAIKLLCNQLSLEMTCVTPGGMKQLNPDASSLLNDILTEVERARVQACLADTTREEWVTGSNSLRQRLDVVRRQLGKAVGDVLEFEKADRNSPKFQELKRTALESLRVPTQTLIAFPEYSIRKEKLSLASGDFQNASAIELIVFLLEGTGYWLDLVLTAAIPQTRDTGNFITADYRPQSRSPDVSEESVGKLLKEYCVDPTPGKIDICRNSCTGAYGQLAKKGGKTLHVAAVLFSLTGGLFGRQWDKLVCSEPPAPDLEKLAEKLVDLFK